MTFQAREYQDAIIDKVRVKLRTVKRVLVQLPTGGGKTVVGGKMIESAAGKGHSCLFTVHRRELIDQTTETFDDVGIRHGIIASGRPYQILERVQVASIDTLKHRMNKGANLFPPKFIMVDEAHHVGAAGWKAVLAAYPDAFVVGLSATPERLDGRGLDDVFEDIVIGPSTGWLIQQGFLSDYRAFAPGDGGPDMRGVETARGDYVRAQTSALMDKPTITGDAIKHYQRLALGQSAVCFCASIEHSQHVAEQFRNAGIMAWHLDGTTPAGERSETIRAFRNGEIKVLSNVDLFGEGFDLPSLTASILLRPTKSLALYLQQVGRCLRKHPGKDRALILDHAGNIARHGLPDEEREWSLKGRDKKKKGGASLDARQCPMCFALHRPAPICPECGHVYGTQSREIDQVDGELKEINVQAERRASAAEQAKAKSIEDLTELGRKRGYKNPDAWAAHVYTARIAAERARVGR